jgi:hypothetical protein
MDLEFICNEVQNLVLDVGAFIRRSREKFSSDKIEKKAKTRLGFLCGLRVRTFSRKWTISFVA